MALVAVVAAGPRLGLGGAGRARLVLRLFLDGELGPAGTDDWTTAEAWSGPLAWPIAGAFVAIWAGVLLTWALNLVPRGRRAAPHAGRAVLVLSAPFFLVFVLVLLLVLSVPLLSTLLGSGRRDDRWRHRQLP